MGGTSSLALCKTSEPELAVSILRVKKFNKINACNHILDINHRAFFLSIFYTSLVSSSVSRLLKDNFGLEDTTPY